MVELIIDVPSSIIKTWQRLSFRSCLLAPHLLRAVLSSETSNCSFYHHHHHHTFTTTTIMSFRAGLRFFNAFARQHTARYSSSSTAAGTNASIPNPATANQSRMQQLWNSKVGPKTVHFWAPIMKWGLVLAGAADFARPVESLSLSQNGALMCTGLIWTRWCFVIRPKNMLYVWSRLFKVLKDLKRDGHANLPQNYSLASVNFLLFCVGATQVSRILLWKQSIKGDTIPSELERAGKQEGRELEAIVKDPKGAYEKAKKV
jgi:hypothetical protein